MFDNRIISQDEYMELLEKSFDARRGSVIDISAPVYILGRLPIIGYNRVLLFDHCEYCGGRKLTPHKFCASCGAPVLPELGWIYHED